MSFETMYRSGDKKNEKKTLIHVFFVPLSLFFCRVETSKWETKKQAKRNKNKGSETNKQGITINTRTRGIDMILHVH